MLFDNPQFIIWVNYADKFNEKFPEKATPIIATLTAHYGDKDLSQILVAAKKVRSTRGIASRLQADQLQSWLSTGKSKDAVFSLLKLDNQVIDLLVNPQLRTWVKYMDDFVVMYPSKRSVMIEELTKTYGDEMLATMLVVAKNSDYTKNIAKHLQTAQIEDWLAGKKSIDDVFRLLNLHNWDGLLSSPVFNTWASYIYAFNKKNPKEKTSISVQLIARYDVSLSKIIEAGLKATIPTSSTSIAKAVQTKQFQRWMAKGNTVDDVVMLLKLDKAGDDLLSSPGFNTWASYISFINKQNPDKKTTLLAKLLESYEVEGLSKMIQAALKVDHSSNIANTLQTELSQRWLISGESVDDVFKLLMLNTAGDKLLDSPQFKTWEKYVYDFRAEFPEKRPQLIDTIAKSYDDETLWNILVAATMRETSKDTAASLQRALVSKWLEAKKPHQDVFKWLKVKGTGPEDGKRLIYNAYRGGKVYDKLG